MLQASPTSPRPRRVKISDHYLQVVCKPLQCKARQTALASGSATTVNLSPHNRLHASQVSYFYICRLCAAHLLRKRADALASGSATTVYLSPPADFKQVKFHIFIFAGVAELADALASGSVISLNLSHPLGNMTRSVSYFNIRRCGGIGRRASFRC